MSKTNLVFAIVKILNCEGEDKILQIQRHIKYLKIKWAVLKWNDWWMLIKASRRLKLQNAYKSDACWNDKPTDFQTLKGWVVK